MLLVGKGQVPPASNDGSESFREHDGRKCWQVHPRKKPLLCRQVMLLIVSCRDAATRRVATAYSQARTCTLPLHGRGLFPTSLKRLRHIPHLCTTCTLRCVAVSLS